MLYNDGLAGDHRLRRRLCLGDLRLDHRDARHLRHHPDGVRHSRRLPRRQARRPAGQQAHRAARHRGRDRRVDRHRRASAPTACCSSSRPTRSAPTRGLFGSAQEKVFMAFALLLGFCMGPMQAASRTLIGRLAPEGMTGEFYGLFALSGRATAWMAPLAIGIVTVATAVEPAGRGVRAGLPGAGLRAAVDGARGAGQGIGGRKKKKKKPSLRPTPYGRRPSRSRARRPSYRGMKGVVRKDMKATRSRSTRLGNRARDLPRVAPGRRQLHRRALSGMQDNIRCCWSRSSVTIKLVRVSGHVDIR